MKKILAVLALVMLSGCLGPTAPFVPQRSFIYDNFKAPLSLEFKNTDLGSKKGLTSMSSFLGLFVVGDVSIAKAAENGGIKVIKHADYAYVGFFGIFQRTMVIVYGD